MSNEKMDVNESLAIRFTQDFTKSLPLAVMENLPNSATRISIVDCDGKLMAAIPESVHKHPEVFAVLMASIINESYGFK